MNQSLEILVELIKDSEGCKLVSYTDTGGVWTVGFGCTGKGIVEGTVWTQAQADSELLARAKKALSDALKYSPVLLSSSGNKQAAIADFIYNLGAGQYQKSTLKKCVDAADWVGATAQILRWNKDNGKVLKGLSIRRQKEADLLERA